MSRTPAFKYEVIQSFDTRKPQIARVYFDDGSTQDFQFGHYVTGSRISELLPKLIMDFIKKKAV
jgi:hypothetical protein